MIDETNPQCSPCRRSGGVPIPKAKRAYIQLRTGYGLLIGMYDFEGPEGADGSQEETINQNIRIFAPQKDNDRGPHLIRLQEAPSGPGEVDIIVGGNYFCNTYDHHVTNVGKEENPSNRITNVSNNTLVNTEKDYINVARRHAFIADDFIYLLAGKDCPDKEGNEDEAPCIWPVLCMTNKGVVMSDRVFCSASEDSENVSVFHLSPFVDMFGSDEPAGPEEEEEEEDVTEPTPIPL
jgi:hypothetical protein